MDPNQLSNISNMISGLSAQAMYGGGSNGNDQMSMMFNQMMPQMMPQNPHRLEEYDDPEVDNIDDILNSADPFRILDEEKPKIK